MGRSKKTALGQTVYRNTRLAAPVRPATVERRVAALVDRNGPMALAELLRALHCNVDQATLHAAIAALRDAGAVEVREERRFKTGRPRVVVAPLGPPPP